MSSTKKYELKPLTIKQAADQAGVGVETIRFYLREGLIEEPYRTESGYRQFDEETVKRIRFIRRAQSLGFSLGEIQELLDIRVTPDATSAGVKALTQKKIKDIDQKIHVLQRMKSILEDLESQCSGVSPIHNCPILDVFDNQSN